MSEILSNSNFWEFIAAQISVFAIGSGLLIWLIKTFFSHLAAKDIETFKISMNKELESFKHELTLINSKQMTVFNELHKQRADYIKECHELMNDTHAAFQTWISPLQYQNANEEKQAEAALTEFNKLIRFYNKKKIFFTEETSNKIIKFLSTLEEASIDYSTAKATGSINLVSELSREIWKESAEARKKAWKQVSKDAVDIKKDLETEFRKLLGV